MIVNIGKSAFDGIFEADKKYIGICDALELMERINRVAKAIIDFKVPDGSYLQIKHEQEKICIGLKADLTLWQHIYWFLWRLKRKLI